MNTSLWTDQMDRLNTLSRDTFGKTTSYQRPDFPAFSIVGMPEFLDRLENVNQGQFYSLFYVVSDFDAATFTASVKATFTGAPASGGMIIFDGITYTAQATLDNSIPNQFFRGGNALAAAVDLAAAINAADGFAGSAYSSATVAHPTCTATYTDNFDSTASVIVSYRTAGLIGDTIMAEDHMSFVGLDSKRFYGGGPLDNDLVTFDGILFRVSDVPEPDPEGVIQVRLEKKAL